MPLITDTCVAFLKVTVITCVVSDDGDVTGATNKVSRVGEKQVGVLVMVRLGVIDGVGVDVIGDGPVGVQVGDCVGMARIAEPVLLLSLVSAITLVESAVAVTVIPAPPADGKLSEID